MSLKRFPSKLRISAQCIFSSAANALAAIIKTRMMNQIKLIQGENSLIKMHLLVNQTINRKIEKERQQSSLILSKILKQG